MNGPEIFAAYLPQYHETEDNNRFWGKGYTDWIAVKNAKPMFEGHYQPRVPLHQNYYDLSDGNVIAAQAKLAREYGIDGFNIYHYWFKDGKQELEKPAELLLAQKGIDIKYFFTWDNAPWKRTWSNVLGNDWAPAFDMQEKDSEEPEILVPFSYGEADQWELHFQYLLPFFKDNRYLKMDGKPVFFFVVSNHKDILVQMCSYWNMRAKENGFKGMYFATKKKNFFNRRILDAVYSYEPETSVWGKRRAIETRIKKFFGISVNNRKEKIRYQYDYRKSWERIIRNAEKSANDDIIGGLVRYDDTPRRGKEAMAIINESPEIFEEGFRRLYQTARSKKMRLILLTAWNEWGEGSYLEPDEESKMEYLKAIKNVLYKQHGTNGMEDRSCL